jgi:hypothetical protein
MYFSVSRWKHCNCFFIFLELFGLLDWPQIWCSSVQSDFSLLKNVAKNNNKEEKCTVYTCQGLICSCVVSLANYG